MMKAELGIFFQPQRLTPTQVRLLIVLIAGVLSILEYIHFFDGAQRWSQVIASNSLRTGIRLQHVLEQPLDLLQKSISSARRIQDLELRYAEAMARIGYLEGLEQENNTLKEMVSRGQISPDVLLAAPVLSYGQPTVNVGSEEGVGVGDLVLANGTLVGVIEESTAHFSTVDLLIANDKHPLVAVTQSGIEGIIIGNGRQLLLSELSPESELVIGETVVTKGQQGIERDILLGKVVSIEFEPSSPVKTAIVEPLVTFEQNRIVQVKSAQ